ncbi:MAG TPA: M1 family aminopeptidase [Puia sp.]|jgi:aminopeptidase N
MPTARPLSFLILLFFTIAASGQGLPDSIGQAGVSFSLANYRAARLTDIHYDLVFHLPAEKSVPVTGEEKLTFQYRDNVEGLKNFPLLLDFKGVAPLGLRVNNQPVPVTFTNEHLRLPTVLLKPGLNTVELRFIAGDAALNRNTDFLYTLLVPDRARTLFPCFDQPNLKAVFTLSLTKPAGWKAIANAPVLDSMQEGDNTRLRFRPSDKISTYLFSFAAGKFAAATTIADGRPMNFLYRETDSTKLRLSLDSIFRIEAQALQFMQTYTGISYPFQKFDFVAIPDFQFGGMEHPGAIQYKASTLFLDSGATREQFISRSNLLSHETAHMWFGDLVTMTWFTDVWMKEVFANFMADITERSEGYEREGAWRSSSYEAHSDLTLHDNNYDLKFLTDHYPAAYSIERTGGTHPIRQKLANLNEAGSLYGNIIYHKAPIVMRQLEQLMGADAFRDGLRDYLKKYAGGNASWPDLVHALQSHTNIDLTAWDAVWVEGTGRPVFSYKLKVKDGKISGLIISQRGENGPGPIQPELFRLALVYADGVEELNVNSSKPSVSLPAAIGKAQPLALLFNSDGRGYGVFPVDLKALPLLPKTSSLQRAASYINNYENMLDGRAFSPRELLVYNRHLLTHEPEELNLNILLDQLQSVFWRFLPPAARDSLAAGLEQDCWSALRSVSSVNERKQLFRTFASIATTQQAMDTIYAVWKQRRAPAGVVLTEDDYTSLAAALALRNYAGSKDILDEQLTRIQNNDRRQRLIYLLPALSNEEKQRDSFFTSLQTPAARRKESWVLTAVGYLHHPFRAASAEKYLQPSLDWLEDIQRTGDVFFPQSWLQASFGWCRTPAEMKIVRNFLAKHPDYNPKLKAKILQATDNLFRANQH